VLEFKTGPPVL